MGWWITLIVLFLLAIFPVGVRIRYDESGFLVRIKTGHFLWITVFPVPKWIKKATSKKKQENTDKHPKKKKPKEKEKKPELQKQKKGGSFENIKPLLYLGLDFLGAFRRKVRIDNLLVNIVLAGGDPCDLAMNYGRAWEAVGNLWPRLERVFVIKRRKIEFQCDFAEENTLITMGVDISITLGRLIVLIVVYGIRALQIINKMKKNSKGGKEK